MAPPELSERQQRILAFEERYPRHTSAKEDAIRIEFALTATRYYQLVNALIDQTAALAAEPQLVYRLRKLRDDREAARTARYSPRNTDSYSAAADGGNSPETRSSSAPRR